MGFIDALLARPQNAIDHGDFEYGPDWSNPLADSGVTVNEQTAMRLVSVYACVTLIADSIRALPVDVFRRSGDERLMVSRPPLWLQSPNPDQTWGQFIDYALHSLLTNGNAFIWLPTRDVQGFPDTLIVLHPDDVSVEKKGPASKTITVQGRKHREFTARNQQGTVLHILGHTADGLVGLSPIEQARQAIGSGLAIEEFGNRFFANGAVTSATVELPQGSVPTPEQLKGLSRQFGRDHTSLKNAWKPIVLANGATYKPMTVPNDQAQFIESARLSVAEIARLYRVPPHLIGDVERSTSWGTGIEQQGIGFVTYTLMPWMVRLEDAFNQLLPRGQGFKFNANGLLRGDTQARSSYYEAMGRLKAIHVNEIRALEDLPPFPDGDNPPPAPNESI